ncbi:hypothetical protein BGZ63DRAFT_458208 [Mariannaea sp. PMI_226]|nr:hypothetical protein BGZ63DRAFT_458208 [Mariannaea sp. PMI_226]
MPPFAAELEAWWLGPGFEAIQHLIHPEQSATKPQECGFDQDIRCRLCAFDNDRSLQADLERAWPAIRAARGINYFANFRKNFKEASQNIFKRTEDGGMSLCRVMEGLGYLDAMELHRFQLLEALHRATSNSAFEDPRLEAIQELDRQAVIHYRHFHLGLRTCVLIDNLSQLRGEADRIPRTMALLNAIFPPIIFLESEEDSDLTPYSAGLLDSIRFSVFQHLMSDEPFSNHRQQAIKMKLLGWCDIPGYDQSRESLLRYFEEVKKLEELCLAVIHASERRSITPLRASIESSKISHGDSLTTLESTSTCTSKTYPETTMRTDFSFESHCSSSVATPASPSPLALLASDVLLHGMPGREISAAKTDGAALRRELNYDLDDDDDDDESEPEKSPSPSPKSPGKGWRRRQMREDIPPVPPLPPIPEQFPTDLTPRFFSKILKKMRSRQDIGEAVKLEDAFGSLRSSSRHRFTSSNLHISNPELIIGANHQHAAQKHSDGETAVVTHLSDLQAGHGAPLEYQIAKPRLSPMEYARLFLIEKGLSDREGRPCELPRPAKKLFWTPFWEKFLIIPAIPNSIRRDFHCLEFSKHAHHTNYNPSAQVDSSTESMMVRAGSRDKDWIRLSLHLGDLPTLFTTVLDPQSPESKDKISESNDGTLEVKTNETTDLKSNKLVQSLRSLDEGLPMLPSSLNQDETRSKASSLILDRVERHQPHQEPIHNILNYNAMRSDMDLQRAKCRGERSKNGGTSSPLLPPYSEIGELAGEMQTQTLTTPNNQKTQSSEHQKPLISAFELSPVNQSTPLSCRKAVIGPESSTPLAHFPIFAQPSARLTPSRLVKRIVKGAGGQLHPHDSLRPRIVQSQSAELPSASSADIWGSLSGNVYPKPLNFGTRGTKQKEYRDDGSSDIFKQVPFSRPEDESCSGDSFDVENSPSGFTPNRPRDQTNSLMSRYLILPDSTQEATDYRGSRYTNNTANRISNMKRSDEVVFEDSLPAHRLQHTPFSTPPSPSSGLFRSQVSSQLGPSTPKTPNTPSPHWQPFQDDCLQPPGSRWDRVMYFKGKAEQDAAHGLIAPTRPIVHKSSLSTIRSKESVRSSIRARQSMESLINWRTFITDAPEPLFSCSSPPPPVPPLPNRSRLPSLYSVVESEATVADGTPARKAKNPKGLQVETQKLRKSSREVLRMRTPSSAPLVGLLSTLKKDSKTTSFREEGNDKRADEVVSRR